MLPINVLGLALMPLMITKTVWDDLMDVSCSVPKKHVAHQITQPRTDAKHDYASICSADSGEGLLQVHAVGQLQGCGVL